MWTTINGFKISAGKLFKYLRHIYLPIKNQNQKVLNKWIILQSKDTCLKCACLQVK